MKWLIFLIMLATVITPATAKTEPAIERTLMEERLGLGQGFIYFYPSDEHSIQLSGYGVSEVLKTINSPDKRTKLAEEWFQIFKQSCTRTWQFQKDQLELQAQHLKLQRELEQLRLETAKLQVEIEKLKAENLKLEKEKLEIQLKLQKETGVPISGSSTPKSED